MCGTYGRDAAVQTLQPVSPTPFTLRERPCMGAVTVQYGKQCTIPIIKQFLLHQECILLPSLDRDICMHTLSCFPPLSVDAPYSIKNGFIKKFSHHAIAVRLPVHLQVHCDWRCIDRQELPPTSFHRTFIRTTFNWIKRVGGTQESYGGR
jgi:hypothetical protein